MEEDEDPLNPHVEYVDREEYKSVWAPWTSNRQESVMLIDGVKIQDLFTRIRKQIESLRGSQLNQEQKFTVLEDRYEEDITFIKEKEEKVVEKAQKEAFGAETMQLVIDVQILRDDLLDQSKLLANHEKRIKALEEDLDTFKPWVELEIDALKKSFTTLSEQHTKSYLKELENEARINKIEANEVAKDAVLADQTADHKADIDKLWRKIKSVEEESVEKKKENSNEAALMLDELREEMALVHLKVQNCEGTVTEGLVESANQKDYLDKFVTDYVDPMKDAILDIRETKADRAEMLGKASIEDMMNRVSNNDFERLGFEFEQMLRRIEQYDQELKFLNSSIDANLEQKSEKIALWCLKVLKKEMAKSNVIKGGGGTGDANGANIGKVKCLVCDQVTNQNTDASNMVFGSKMQNVIEQKHRTQVYALEKGDRPNSPAPVYGDRRKSTMANMAISPEQIDQRRSWSPSFLQHSPNPDNEVSLVLVNEDTAMTGTGTGDRYPGDRDRERDRDDIGMRTSNNFSNLLPKISAPHRGSKLVRMGAIPFPDDSQKQGMDIAQTVDAILASSNKTTAPPSNDITVPQHRIGDEDFNYRLKNEAGMVKDGGGAGAGAGGVIDIHSGYDQAVMAGQGLGGPNNQVSDVIDVNPLLPGARSAKYFKDLEQRFASTSTRRNFSNTEEVQRIRPITAPLRPLLSRSQQGL